MVGENIQKIRNKIQSTRSQMMGGMAIGEKLQNVRILSSNPGILNNFKIGQRIQETVHSVRGKTIAQNPKTYGGSGVVTERTAPNQGRKTIVV